jgi:hypothetical protein
MRITFFTLIVLLIYSCKNNSKTDNKISEDDSTKFFEINLEKGISNKQTIPLSQIASDVEYIVLETKEDCMVRPVVRYYFTDSLIFIRNFVHILKFSRNGKFIQRIGTSGRGPGEIDLIRNLSFLPDKKTLVVQKNYQRELLFFSFTGELIKTLDYEPHIESFKILPNGNFLTYESGASGTEDVMFCIMNENWDTLSTIRNYSKWTSTPSSIQIMIGYPAFEPFYFSQNSDHLKSMYNDTVYQISSDKIEPEYFINLGKHKLPEELRPERLGVSQIQKFRDNGHSYYFAQVFEAYKKIFISAFNYGESESSKYLIYDKLKKECSLLTNYDNKSSGFVNDWDGGIDFWPTGQLNDNQVFMPITPLQFKKLISEKNIENNKIKFPENKSKLLKLISSLAETDNPILMVVTLKQK